MSRRTPRTFLLAVALLTALGAVLGGVYLLRAARDSSDRQGAGTETARVQPRYRCPMHPTMVSDRPGNCPICQMRMVPTGEEEKSEASTAQSSQKPAAERTKRIVYRSTMNPSEVSDQPGLDSMGMQMVREEIDEPLPGGGPAVEGRATVRISPQKRQLIGVRTVPAQWKPLIRTMRTVGRVTYDETRLHHIHTKVGGWIERLYADATGELVRQGQPLLTIYSPELLASGQEYLLALQARERLADATLPSIRENGEQIVESARRRLLLFDLSAEQIEALERSGEAPRTMTLHAPVTGHVIARNVTQGERIEPGMNLLDIANLSRVWVLADIYEYELPFVHQGQAGTLTLSYLPGQSFQGRIRLVYPVLSEMTRTVKVRLEFPNADLALKPEMFGEVEIQSDLGRRLVVPESAVISSGRRDVVFVDRGEGYFEPREVKVGLRLPDSFEILEGVKEGEPVLVSGNFLIDSESKLKAALSAAGAPTPPAATADSPPSHRH